MDRAWLPSVTITPVVRSRFINAVAVTGFNTRGGIRRRRRRSSACRRSKPFFFQAPLVLAPLTAQA